MCMHMGLIFFLKTPFPVTRYFRLSIIGVSDDQIIACDKRRYRSLSRQTTGLEDNGHRPSDTSRASPGRPDFVAKAGRYSMGRGSTTVVIRPEKPQDYAGVHEINRLAFRREGEARLIESLRGAPGFISDLSIVAIGGKNVVGHILFSPVSIETPGGEVPALVLAPMAVRPEYQREDLRERLLRQGLKECQRLGHRCVVATGAPDQLKSFGFSPAQWKGLKPSVRIPEGDLMVLELMPGVLDGVKGTVKFPPVFNELWEAATF